MVGIKNRHSHVQDLENGLDGAISMLHTILTVEGAKNLEEIHSDLKEKLQFQFNAGSYSIEDPSFATS